MKKNNGSFDRFCYLDENLTSLIQSIYFLPAMVCNQFRSFTVISFLYISALLFAGPSNAYGQSGKRENLEKSIRNCETDTCKIRNIANLGLYLINNTEYGDSGIQKLNEALKLTNKLISNSNDPLFNFLRIQKAKIYNHIAYGYRNQDQYDSALSYYMQCLNLYLQIGGKNSLSGVYNNISAMHHAKGNLVESLDFAYRAQKIDEEKGEFKWMILNYNIIGEIYMDMNKHSEALHVLKKAIELPNVTSDNSNFCSALISIGDCYSVLLSYDSAIHYYNLALALPENLYQWRALVGMGEVMEARNKDPEAIVFYQEALAKLSTSGDKLGYNSVRMKFGNLFLKEKKYDEAQKVFEEALNYCNSKNFRLGIVDCLEKLYQCTSEKGSYKEAYEYLNQYVALKDSLLNSENAKAIEELNIKFETARKDKELVLLGKERDLQNYKLNQQQQQIALNHAEFERKEVQIKLFNRDKQLTEINSKRNATELKNQQLLNEKINLKIITLTNLKKLQEASLFRERIFRNSAIVFIVFLVIVGILFFNRIQTNKKYALVLEEKNRIIEKEKEKAVKSEYYKTQFLANMSHEIRTPLHAIIGMINVLNQRNPRDDQSVYLGVMHKSSVSLIDIINNVLDLSKIESGKIEFNFIPFSPKDAIDSVVNMLHVQAKEKGIVLQTGNLDVPDWVEGDKVRLNQVLINLIGNAIKFTNEGQVIVSAKVIDSGTEVIDKLVIEFTVQDTGIGIPENKKDRIFDSFVQADEGITRKFGGTGLGLTISKQLVEQQGGRMFVTSEIGNGSSFSFLIPYGKVVSHISESEAEFKLNPEGLNGARILIVEDNYYNRIVAIETLNMLIKNPVIDEAENGEIAIQMILNSSYDFIFMDLQMPVLDGYSTMKVLNDSYPEKISSVFIIGLSANATNVEREKCISAGMTDYLSKPFNPQDLLKVMLRAKEKHA